ncbi:hypothetical protein D3C75_1134710 [compost metagenome]
MRHGQLLDLGQRDLVLAAELDLLDPGLLQRRLCARQLFRELAVAVERPRLAVELLQRGLLGLDPLLEGGPFLRKVAEGTRIGIDRG